MLGRTANRVLPVLYNSAEVSKFKILQCLSLGTSSLLIIGTPAMFVLSESAVPLGVQGIACGMVMGTGLGAAWINHKMFSVFVSELRGDKEVVEFTTLDWRNRLVQTQVPVKELGHRESPVYLLVDKRDERKYFVPEQRVVELIEQQILPVSLLPENFEQVHED